jgi:hypothetical protein
MTVLLILGAPTIVINLRGPESARSRSASEQIDGDARARFYCQSVGSGAKARAGAALGVLEAAYRRQAGGVGRRAWQRKDPVTAARTLVTASGSAVGCLVNFGH